jgi:tetratricopeptide (TPR) repeat protein
MDLHSKDGSVPTASKAEAEAEAETEAETEAAAAAELKSKGNEAFKNGEFDLAVRLFTQAIAIDASSAILFANRAQAYASQEKFNEAIADAAKAVGLDAKYGKAHYRLIKGLLAVQRYRESRIAFHFAIKECGDSKEMAALEKDIVALTGHPMRPKPSDFEIMEELGEGNYTTIYKGTFRATGKVYAIKTIEKTKVDRMKRRHPNINNEIFMEKRVLGKLEHPNIVQLYATFQDYGTLYYLMEFMAGGELWKLLQDRSEGHDKCQVGCPWSMIPFLVAEAINGLEFMHRRGVCHR